MSFRMTIRKEGTLDGWSEDVWREQKGRARVAVERATDKTLSVIDSALSRVGRPIRGQPPRMVTGELRASFRKLPLRTTKYTVSSGIQSKHPGANRLEFGKVDKKGRRTFPHPFVRPTFERLRAFHERLFGEV